GIRPQVSITDARIIDLAPTVLSLFGLEAPTDMDGRVLKEILEGPVAAGAVASGTAKVPATTSAGSGSGRTSDDESAGYSAGEEEMIAARLKALGYVE